MDRIGILTVIVVSIFSFALGIAFLMFGANEWTILSRALFLVGQWVVGCVIYVIVESAP